MGDTVGSVISFDCETHLIAPGLLAPPLVCVQWATLAGPKYPQLKHRDHARAIIVAWLASDGVLVGHNVAFDMAVNAAQWPELLPAIFAKYDRDQVTDTKIREQLIMIARGQFRSWEDDEGELHPVKYALSDCMQRHFGQPLKKEGWRLFYRAFDGTPDLACWEICASAFQSLCRQGLIPDWVRESPDAMKALPGLLAADPAEARLYALEDARATLALHQSQERVAAGMADYPGVLDDQYRQARAAFALHLSSCWGIHTDPDAVETLATKLNTRFEELKADLQSEGIIRANGTADTKAARAAMVQACAEESLPVLMTKGGVFGPNGAQSSPPQVSLSAEACGRFDEFSVIGQYSEFLTVRKTLSNDIKMLRSGTEIPIQPRYDLADTGRTRAAKPNIQAINRGEGIRDCFVPRPGTVFIQGDFESLELHTLAQWCLTVIGRSALAEALNKKIDVHSLTGAQMSGVPYDEIMSLKKTGDARIKDIRQGAKAVNFGLPGGLGAKKLARYAKVQYDVNMTVEEGIAAKAVWLGLYPEMNEFFAMAAMATRDGDANEQHIFTGRWRGRQRYSALCNGRFQGLGADAAKEALWRVTRACYVEKSSALFGCRVVAFIHDEILAEALIAQAPAAAKELGRLMCEGANAYLKDVPVRVEPLIMDLWSKKAEPIYGDDGELKVWRHERT
jgi:DNA polymerase-1